MSNPKNNERTYGECIDMIYLFLYKESILAEKWMFRFIDICL